MGNPVMHFEIGCLDRERTSEFYAALFDWKMAAMGPATMNLRILVEAQH
jgi:predicted enzyme related to lactoylglutathione lyase